MNSQLLYEDELAGGCHWSLRMKRGTSLRLIDKQGGANVGMLLYNPENLLEKYNAPDTLKCQHTFKLTRGHCLYSDMGRILCSITEDSIGWHETVCGNTTRKIVAKKWGVRNYQDHLNDWQRNGYDSFLVELAKYGLGRRDMASNVNLFSRVEVDDSGMLSYVSDNSKADDFIELRFEMDTLVLFHTCPHPLNPSIEYPRKTIRYQIRKAEPVKEDDYCKNFCAENQRGFKNTDVYHLGAQHD